MSDILFDEGVEILCSLSPYYAEQGYAEQGYSVAQS